MKDRAAARSWIESLSSGESSTSWSQMHESSKEANNQYLLEIGLEEMPAGMILPAVEQLKKAAET